MGEEFKLLIINKKVQQENQVWMLFSVRLSLSKLHFHFSSDAVRIRRELLARQPSYCKILNDLKEVESSESEDQEIPAEVTEKQEKDDVTGHDLVMKGETIEVVEGAPQSVSSATNNFIWFNVTRISDTDCSDQWSSLPNSDPSQPCQQQHQCGQCCQCCHLSPDCHQCPVHFIR